MIFTTLSSAFKVFVSLTFDIQGWSKESQIGGLQALISQLPKENKLVLARLFLFMSRIIEHEAQNKMAVHNVATVFAPNLLRSRSEFVIIEDTVPTNAIVCSMIIHRDEIFQVESFETLNK